MRACVFVTPNMRIAAVICTFTGKPSVVSCHQGLDKSIIFIVMVKYKSIRKN
jgi:hypothetical protein